MCPKMSHAKPSHLSKSLNYWFVNHMLSKRFLLSSLFGYTARWHFHLKAQPLKTHTHKVSVCSSSKHLATQRKRWYWSRSKYSSPATPTQNGHNWRDFGVAILRHQLVVVSEDLIIWNCNQYQYYQWYPIGTPRSALGCINMFWRTEFLIREILET